VGVGAVGFELPCYLLDYLWYIVPGQWNCQITVIDVPSAAGDCLCRPGFYRVRMRIGTLPLPGTLRWHITNNNNNTNTAETNNQAITTPRVCHLLARRFLPRMCNVHLPIIPPSFHCYVCATDTDSTPQIVVITILTILFSHPINLV